jgi:hypothetical protein
MILFTARRQQRTLAAMHSALRDSDPHLVARFATFTRRNAAAKIPGIERVRAWPVGWPRAGGRLVARHFTRLGRRLGWASGRLRGAVFIPVAAAVLLAVVLLLAIGGARARCTPRRAAGQSTAGQRAAGLRTATATVMPQLAAAPGCPPGPPPASGR